MLMFFCGPLAILLLVISMSFSEAGKFKPALLVGIMELVPGCVFAAAWMSILWNSGKADWFLMGVLNYPPIGIIFIAAIVLSIWNVRTNAEMVIRQKKGL